MIEHHVRLDFTAHIIKFRQQFNRGSQSCVENVRSHFGIQGSETFLKSTCVRVSVFECVRARSASEVFVIFVYVFKRRLRHHLFM